MKSIVIYFSRADENYSVGYVTKGNTEYIAEYIQEFTGADLFKVEGVKPYAKDYKTCIKEAKEYQETNARPKLKQYLDSIEDYDIIYIGGPNYWGELPYEMYSELDKLNFSGKIVKPFCTHEGSGLSNIPLVLKQKCVGAIIKDGLAIQGSTAKEMSTKEKVKNWIEM